MNRKQEAEGRVGGANIRLSGGMPPEALQMPTLHPTQCHPVALCIAQDISKRYWPVGYSVNMMYNHMDCNNGILK